MAWAQEAKIEACHVQTSSINIKKLISEIPEIRKMTLLKPKEFCPLLRSALNECGIALVFLLHLKGFFLHGVAFLDGKKIVVGRMQVEGIIRFNMLNNLKEKYVIA